MGLVIYDHLHTSKESILCGTYLNGTWDTHKFDVHVEPVQGAILAAFLLKLSLVTHVLEIRDILLKNTVIDDGPLLCILTGPDILFRSRLLLISASTAPSLLLFSEQS